MVKDIFVSRDLLISVRVRCEILDFVAEKFDLFYARDVSISINMLLKMRIIGVKLINCKSIVQKGVKILRNILEVDAH